MRVIGNIGSEVQKLNGKNGKPFYRFTLAENFNKGDQKETVWYDVNAFLSDELSGDLLAKGQLVEVIGKVEAKAFNRKDGTPAAALNLTGFKVEPAVLEKKATVAA